MSRPVSIKHFPLVQGKHEIMFHLKLKVLSLYYKTTAKSKQLVEI